MTKEMSGKDPWLIEHEACVRLGQDIIEKIRERNKQPKGSTIYAKHSAHVRTSLRQYSKDVRTLKDHLLRSASQYTVTQRELERRQLLLDALVTKESQLEKAFKHEQPYESRTELFSQGPGPGSHDLNPFAADMDQQNIPDLTVHDIRQQQSQIIREQDAGLDALSNVLGRQKQMAVDIGNEVDTQNELIDDITDHATRTDSRIVRETRHIRLVDRKSKTCALWVVIILLGIAIVVIAVVPYNGKP